MDPFFALLLLLKKPKQLKLKLFVTMNNWMIFYFFSCISLSLAIQKKYVFVVVALYLNGKCNIITIIQYHKIWRQMCVSAKITQICNIRSIFVYYVEAIINYLLHIIFFHIKRNVMYLNHNKMKKKEKKKQKPRRLWPFCEFEIKYAHSHSIRDCNPRNDEKTNKQKTRLKLRII